MRALVLAMALLAGCARAVVPAAPDGGSTPTCAERCYHLSRLGCGEGDAPQCESTCAAPLGTGVAASVDWHCVDLATTAAGAQTCGPRFCLGITPR